VKGDRVEIVVDAGGAGPLRYEVVATRAGRRVETTIGRGVVEVAEVTRGGTVVRTARFLSSRVLALVEHPVPRAEPGEAAPRPSHPVGPEQQARPEQPSEPRQPPEPEQVAGSSGTPMG
jgi:hypothetical protein